ncbi:hypothetical protein OROHE_013912 [Orobanche hederae]
MTIRTDYRSRIRTRATARTARRLLPCYRHPDDPITGICASCLRERLSGLDAAGYGGDAGCPEFRRCRSVVSTSRCEASSSSHHEPRRKSCDVVSARGSLSNLFDMDDLKSGSEREAKVESKNVGLSRVSYTVTDPRRKNRDQARVLDGGFGGLDVGCDNNSEEEAEEGELKSMKEYIDLEFGNKSKKTKDLRDIAGNFFGAASVYSKKLRKWRQKNSKIKENKHNTAAGNDGNSKQFGDVRKLGGNHSEIVGRRSCDLEPRFSVDGGRISFEEPRASWDGYMIARSIPRLAPMFSVVENGILGIATVDGPMHSIIEDESSSGASGFGHSNSDSSSSMRRSSFDRSSSVRSFGKKGISLEDHGVSSPANVKLVITEKELKDWHLSSGRDDELEKIASIPINAAAAAAAEGVGNTNALAKKSVRWRKICNVLDFKNKNRENIGAVDPSMDASREKQAKEASDLLRDVGDWKLARSSSVVVQGNHVMCRDHITRGGVSTMQVDLHSVRR